MATKQDFIHLHFCLTRACIERTILAWFRSHPGVTKAGVSIYAADVAGWVSLLRDNQPHHLDILIDGDLKGLVFVNE